MSAEQLGQRLLDEVEEASFDELLSEIRAVAPDTQKSNLSIPELDRVIEVLQRPRAAVEKPRWASPQGSSDDGETSYYHGPNESTSRESWAAPGNAKKAAAKAVQLTSFHSAAGKTSLLYYLAAISILPKAYGGNEATIVWIDTDGRFSALRIAQQLRRTIQSRSSITPTKPDLDLQIRESLSHVHVFQPQSSAQLISTLITLPDYLFSKLRHHSHNRLLALLILDSATSFYWPDRADAELARLSDPSTPTPPSPATQTITQLKGLASTLACTILFTTDASLHLRNRRLPARPASAATRRTVGDPPLPPQNETPFQDPWTQFATVTLEVNRVAVPRFAPAMTVEECAVDQPRRVEAVRKGRCWAAVVGIGGEEGSRTDLRGEGFGFRVTGEGVELE